MGSRYPQEWIEALRERADIVSIVSEYVPLKQNGRRYWGLCPFHNEKTASFSVDPDQGLFYCFGCKAGGSVIQFIMQTERMEFSEAVRYLADKLRVPLPEGADNAQAMRESSIRERILAINRNAANIFHQTLYAPEGAGVLKYLHGRGLDDQVIRVFGIGAAPPGWDTLTARLLADGCSAEELVQAGLTVEKGGKRYDMFRGRAIFPILSGQGAVLGFGGRAMGDAQPKYLNTADTPAFNKRANVYGQNLLRKSGKLSRVLLVEGYMDVVSLVSHDIEGVAATLGTALGSDQARLLKRYAPEVWIAYDGDTAGQNAALRALDVFAALDIPARVLVFPDGMDPDEFIRAKGRGAFDALQPLAAPVYRMQRAAEGLDLSGEEGRTQYAIACASIVKSVKQPVERENLLQRLMVETGYTRAVLLQQIGSAAPEKPVYKEPTQREKIPMSTRFLTDHLKAERLLLSMMAAGLVPEGIVEAERFSDENHRHLARLLLAGKHAPELLEGMEDGSMREVMLEVFSREPSLYGDEPLQVVAECLERMRRGAIDTRIKALTDGLSQATGNDKFLILQEITSLNKERERLRPGRKE